MSDSVKNIPASVRQRLTNLAKARNRVPTDSRPLRTHDQMVQAARSGVRNISEGSGAAATSRKSEMLLTNVARASLSDELAKDYKSFLIQHGLRVWHKDSPEALATRARLKQVGQY